MSGDLSILRSLLSGLDGDDVTSLEGKIGLDVIVEVPRSKTKRRRPKRPYRRRAQREQVAGGQPAS